MLDIKTAILNVMQPRRTNKGFTVVELLVASAVLTITFVVVISMAMAGRQKSLLIAETTKLKAAIEYTRQQSLAAYQGNEYSIVINPATSTFTIYPEETIRTLKVDFNQPSQEFEILFKKITGKTTQNYTIVLEAGNLKTTISISQDGIINQEKPTTK